MARADILVKTGDYLKFFLVRSEPPAPTDGKDTLHYFPLGWRQEF
jgi:hypothetical protein